jgi:hypothetical protein
MLTLKNKRLSLTIDPEHGSNMISFKVGKQELIYCDRKFRLVALSQPRQKPFLQIQPPPLFIG